MHHDPGQLRYSELNEVTWTEYYARIRRRRIAEARILHQQRAESGVDAETILLLDFLHFGNFAKDVRQLANQLAENYSMVVTPRDDGVYWNAEGTTRPEGIHGMDELQCTEWVAFMCDVANSYGCVFSTWRFTDPVRNRTWTNETIDVDPEVEGG